ncbi:hypothetical protein [Vibrio splendidus]|uniref:hypothetical protein n=1 Tax=Vibrio splendidus TaxID=29497 RepID=UPI0024688E6B|nr:hypothetical protein [Vibrio splendidus]MDH5915064.1 hypothetical protein [Vibrio splendidus]
MPMFDIEDCNTAELEDNKTDKEQIAKIKNVDEFKAKGNEVKTSGSDTNSWLDWLKDNVLGALIAAVIAGLIVAYLVYKLNWS